MALSNQIHPGCSLCIGRERPLLGRPGEDPTFQPLDFCHLGGDVTLNLHLHSLPSITVYSPSFCSICFLCMSTCTISSELRFSRRLRAASVRFTCVCTSASSSSKRPCLLVTVQ
ncbi:hypothetical protein EYF80_003157 [Liparis tanakae]|uniref:Uncharacterized protein n=1 Tax=Liparis tanakae TaxID=230148 RepID=A0A4Z2J925_9TELE|nr:hypothetical protein EYF80_003157 [Liparis tanakae]